MWSKNSGNFSVRAQTAAAVLMAATEKAAPHLLRSLVGENCIDANKELITPLTSELLIFGLHLTDRIALGRLGANDRAEFMDALLPAIQDELQLPLNSRLEDLYNTRNTFYGEFRKLYPAEKESLKGTLFWEFGKALGVVFANSNPARISETSIFGMVFMQTVNNDFDAENVFL